MAKKTDTTTTTNPPPRFEEAFDATYVAEALENARRQLAIVAAVRAEFDHALTSVIDAQSWVTKGAIAEPFIAKDANIPAGT